MRNFGATIKKHYGMLWYFLEWPIATGLSWYTNMAAVSLFWNTNTAVVTSSENALYFDHVYHFT